MQYQDQALKRPVIPNKAMMAKFVLSGAFWWTGGWGGGGGRSHLCHTHKKQKLYRGEYLMVNYMARKINKINQNDNRESLKVEGLGFLWIKEVWEHGLLLGRSHMMALMALMIMTMMMMIKIYKEVQNIKNWLKIDWLKMVFRRQRRGERKELDQIGGEYQKGSTGMILIMMTVIKMIFIMMTLSSLFLTGHPPLQENCTGDETARLWN